MPADHANVTGDVQAIYRMKPTPPQATPATAIFPDIAAATEQLFDDIAQAAGSEALRSSMLELNAKMRAIRPYEAEFFFDRDQELAELSSCWTARDLPRLQTLLSAYFARRQAIVPELAQRMNPPS